MLVTLMLPDEWGRSLAPKIVTVVGASLFLGGLLWNFFGVSAERAQAQAPALSPTPSVTQGNCSINGNVSGGSVNQDCSTNTGPKPRVLSDDQIKYVSSALFGFDTKVLVFRHDVSEEQKALLEQLKACLTLADIPISDNISVNTPNQRIFNIEIWPNGHNVDKLVSAINLTKFKIHVTDGFPPLPLSIAENYREFAILAVGPEE